MRALLACAVVLGLTACSPARPPEAPPAGASEGGGAEVLTPATSPIALRRSALADEYFWLRAKALEGDAPAPFGDALAAMKALRADLAADPTAWEDLEVPLGRVDRASDLVAVYQALPETRDVGGQPVPLRERAVALARALRRSEGAYRDGPYKESRAAIDAAASDLKARLLPVLPKVLAAIESDMSLPKIELATMAITLVGDAPYPGIFAADARGHASASFVRVRGLAGGELVETVLHESLHAIDELSVRTPTTAMNMLRSALGDRGIDENDSNVEMAVNTVTFAEAGSLVRRYVDPGYRPMGETGFYTLYPPAPSIVAAWDRHLAGEPLDATADAIAKAVAGPATEDAAQEPQNGAP